MEDIYDRYEELLKFGKCSDVDEYFIIELDSSKRITRTICFNKYGRISLDLRVDDSFFEGP